MRKNCHLGTDGQWRSLLAKGSVPAGVASASPSGDVHCRSFALRQRCVGVCPWTPSGLSFSFRRISGGAGGSGLLWAGRSDLPAPPAPHRRLPQPPCRCRTPATSAPSSSCPGEPPGVTCTSGSEVLPGGHVPSPHTPKGAESKENPTLRAVLVGEQDPGRRPGGRRRRQRRVGGDGPADRAQGREGQAGAGGRCGRAPPGTPAPTGRPWASSSFP